MTRIDEAKMSLTGRHMAMAFRFLKRYRGYQRRLAIGEVPMRMAHDIINFPSGAM